MSEKFNEILKEATKDYENNMNYIDFHNKYHGADNKYVPEDMAERKEFLYSP